MAELPLVDEHEVEVDASPAAVWAALARVLDGFGRPPAAAYARLVGCRPVAVSGPRPLAVGSEIPGFRVTESRPSELLVLEGRHRFSTYALTFRFDGRRLVAESRAAFPGPHGRAYRLAVVGSGFHARAVRGLLASVARGVSA